MGCATAFELAKQGMKPLVVDKEAGAGQDRVPAGGARIGDQPDASATDSSVDAPAELAAGVRPVDLEGRLRS